MYKIMTIEDDVIFLETLKDYFEEEEEYVIEGYTTSKPALKQIEHGYNYDLILLDYFLKNENGANENGEKIVKKIRAINNNIFICLLTAYSDKITSKNAFKLSVQGYIEKSGDYDQMANAIKSIVHSSKKAQEFLKKDPKQLFSKRLKILRLRSNLSQQELANKIGLTRNAISNYEIGKAEPSFTVLSNMASIFNTSTDYLIGRTD